MRIKMEYGKLRMEAQGKTEREIEFLMDAFRDMIDDLKEDEHGKFFRQASGKTEIEKK